MIQFPGAKANGRNDLFLWQGNAAAVTSRSGRNPGVPAYVVPSSPWQQSEVERTLLVSDVASIIGGRAGAAAGGPEGRAGREGRRWVEQLAVMGSRMAGKGPLPRKIAVRFRASIIRGPLVVRLSSQRFWVHHGMRVLHGWQSLAG